MSKQKHDDFFAGSAIAKISEFQKFGSKLGLERMNALLSELGNPHDSLKVIHVAGTNGKGSICRYLYSVLLEGGYSVGLYTSPFLEVFNERIQLDGENISDEDLELYTDEVLAATKRITDRGEQSPTEFEVITAVAFLYFHRKKCDYVVLEVGLGGRGDSTNVCKNPLASVIASISFDHTDRLGNTLAEIAGEKAGIIKEGCPVICSAEAQEALEVIRKVAAEKKAAYTETCNMAYTKKEAGLFGYKFDVTLRKATYDDVEISMAGEHQIKNAIAALATLDVLVERGEVSLSREQIYAGLKKAVQHGRLEVLSPEGAKLTVIIDGAHNPDGAASLRRATEQLLGDKKILMVCGMLEDKDTEGIISEFARITKNFIATEPVSNRRMSAEELCEGLRGCGAECTVETDGIAACELAVERAKAEGFDAVVVAGSLYLIGAVRGALKALQ